MTKFYQILVLTVVVAFQATSQITIVKDINQTTFGSHPKEIIEINGITYFSASDGVNGQELWKSDGTESGTVMVKDIHSGISSSNLKSFTNVNGVLYFIAYNSDYGEEIWKSDGTESGTVMVKDINVGNAGSRPDNLTNVNGILYFTAHDGVNGVELWKSDGTEFGTILVKDINPGISWSEPGNLTNVGGTLYFSANDGVNGTELWNSDGTESGTTLVKNINIGGASSNPLSLINFNGNLYFRANDGVNGAELWKSDGTEVGTQMLTDINSAGSSWPGSFTTLGGMLYFRADDGITGSELWKTDGTSAGTVLISDINLGGGSSPLNLASAAGTLYFTADDGINGRELWASDGTEAGTFLVKDINTVGNSSPLDLTNVNGILYFVADDGLNGKEVWKSNGTESGTLLLKDINSSGSSNPLSLTLASDGNLYFNANDGVNGSELWVSDGTEAGTLLLKDISKVSQHSSPKSYQILNGITYFTADDGLNGRELWKSDGTTAGSSMVKDIWSGTESSNPENLINVDGILYFKASDGTNGFELWRSDGTEAGTTLVKDINIGSGSSNPDFLTDINGILYFTADDGANGRELWKSDGTDAGTVMVKDINSGVSSSNPDNIINVGGILYFTANDGINGFELWKSDGTDIGTVLVRDIITGGSSSYPRDLINVNGTIYFHVSDGYGAELWKSNGTLAGTVLVKTIYGGRLMSSAYPDDFLEIDGTLYFSAFDQNGRQIWKSDGTESGTVIIKNIGTNANAQLLTSVNDVLYFIASDEIHGQELWKSDGTEAGTLMIQVINPAGSTQVRKLKNINNVLYFLVRDGSGYTIWKSNGKACGTNKITDNELVSTDNFAVNGNRLFITGSSTLYGHELFLHDLALDLPDTCKEEQAITFNTLEEKIYGEANFNLNAFSSSGLDITYTSSNPSVASISGNVVSIHNSGSITITASQAGNENYEPAEDVIQSLIVNAAPLIVTANNQNREYGAEDPEFTITYDGFANGENEADITAPVPGTAATATSNVGNYPITLTGGSADNYDITLTEGNLEIVKATLAITAEDKVITYGDALPTLTQTISGFVNGEDESVLDNLPQLSTTASEGMDAGTYSITSTGGNDVNYSFNYTDGVLSIDKAVLTVTADDQSKVYGEENPELSFSYSGFVNGDDVSVLDTPPSPATAADGSSTVGSYPISFSEGTDNNYDINTVEGTLTVDKAILAATADNQNREYGAEDPEFTITYDGFVNGENEADITAPAPGTAATATSNVGNYPITLTGGSADNYDITLSEGNLEIVKATLSITAEDKVITYGGALPTLTQTITGFVNGEDESVLDNLPQLSTTASEGIDAGNYPITSTGGNDVNYSFNYTDGVLSINKAGQTISFGTLAEKTFGDATFDLTATSSSGLPVSYTSSDGTVATIAGGTVTIVGAGTTSIIASQLGNANYEAATDVERVLTVNKADQDIIIAAIADKQIDAAPFEVETTVNSGLTLTYSITGPASISGTTITLDGTEGTVELTASQVGNENYNPASASTSFIVTDPCVDFDAQVINVMDVLCNGEANGSFEVSTTGGTAPFIYTMNAAEQESAVFSDLSAGSYQVIVMDANNCSKTVTVTLEEPTIISISAEVVNSTSIEGNGSITLTTTGGTGNLSYEWSNGATTGNITDLEIGEYTVTVTDENSCSLTENFMVGGVTANTEALKSEVIIYPNPTANSVNIIHSSEVESIKLYNAHGKMIKNHRAAGTESSLELNQLSAGLYFIQLGSDDRVHRIMKK